MHGIICILCCVPLFSKTGKTIVVHSKVVVTLEGEKKESPGGLKYIFIQVVTDVIQI